MSAFLVFLGILSQAAKADEDRWWPVQTVPGSLVRTRELHLPVCDQMLVQSVAGLAAKAVNEKQGDELVWVSSDNRSLEAWYAAFLKKHSLVEVRGEYSPWELVDRFSKRGIIKSYQTFVGETDGLLAVLVFQYDPYEGGAGKTFWVKDRRGIEVPVISARYSIWEHSNKRLRAGTPAKVARKIQQSANDERTRDAWAIVNAWSYFRRVPEGDENAENMRQDDAATQGGLRGYSPAAWCAERFAREIRVVPPEELAWRIRMKHDATVTQSLLPAAETR